MANNLWQIDNNTPVYTAAEVDAELANVGWSANYTETVVTAWEDVSEWDAINFYNLSNIWDAIDSSKFWVWELESIVWDSHISYKLDTDKVIYLFRDIADSNKWKAVIWTISWTNITLWTIYTFDSWVLTSTSIRWTVLDSNRIFIHYEETWTNTVKCQVLTISWNTITPWPITDTWFFSSDNKSKSCLIWTDKLIFGNNAYSGCCLYVVTISWSSVSLWTYQFYTASSDFRFSLVWLGVDKALFWYTDDSNNISKAFVITVSWTVMTFETAWEVSLNLRENANYCEWVLLETDKVLLVSWLGTVTTSDRAQIVTISWTTCSAWTSVYVPWATLLAKIDSTTAICWYAENVHILTISWTDITCWDTKSLPYSIYSLTLLDISRISATTAISDWWFILSTEAWSYVKSDASDSNNTNFAWFATASATSWNDVTIATAWTLGGFSNLTVWAEYYLADVPWTISTTAGSNSVKVGKALSSTELLIESWGLEEASWGGGDVFPRNIYVSETQTWANSTVFTFTHNLWLTQADFILWRYKVTVNWWNASSWGIYWDQYWSTYDWGGMSSTFNETSPLVEWVWTSANPTETKRVHMQENDVKIMLWTSWAANLTQFKLIIQQMW